MYRIRKSAERGQGVRPPGISWHLRSEPGRRDCCRSGEAPGRAVPFHGDSRQVFSPGTFDAASSNRSGDSGCVPDGLGRDARLMAGLERQPRVEVGAFGGQD